jgi:hypothetical protein
MGRVIGRALRWLAYIVATIVVLAALVDYAYSHSWYDKYCCSERDCGPVLGAEYGDGGLRVETAPGVWMSVPAGMQLRPSGDQNWHICIMQGSVRCIYAPAGA